MKCGLRFRPAGLVTTAGYEKASKEKRKTEPMWKNRQAANKPT